MALPTSSVSGSVNSANSQNWSTSGSQTYGTEATSAARAAAEYANELAIQRWKMQAEYNAQQAEIQRNWQEKMANSVYQRTMQDMRSAGLNPILAAGGGLGTASVSGGAAASVGAPDSYMPNVYPDSISSAQSQGNSQSNGSSWGESGFATFLESMATLAQGILNGVNSSHTINIALQGLESAKGVIEDATNPTSYAKDYKGADEKGKPTSGYTPHYDSEKSKYLTEDEVKKESFVDGLIRGIKNKTNALLGIK